MYSIISKAHKNKINLNTSIKIDKAFIVQGDGIIKDLENIQNLTILELLTFMIIYSDNTATNILIDLIGFDFINENAKILNLKNTSLNRKMMDFEKINNGIDNFTSASDLTIILEYIYYYSDNYFRNIMIDILKNQKIKGGLDLHLPKDLIIGHKTGDLDHLEHDVGIVFLENNNYIICVLTKNIINLDAKKLIGEISKITFDFFQKKKDLRINLSLFSILQDDMLQNVLL